MSKSIATSDRTTGNRKEHQNWIGKRRIQLNLMIALNIESEQNYYHELN